MTRAAPSPTTPDGRGGVHRMSPAFVEWMMGLPAGHVTDVGITRSEQLKALGNGVVPQQAELAVRTLLNRAA
jgi:DNA (cytosine-5)-methyltransferase 1